MEKEIKIKQIVSYGGHTISGNGAVNLTFTAAYSELTQTIKLQQLLDCDVEIRCRIAGENDILKLGLFKIKQSTISGDGVSKIKFVGLKEYIETDNLNNLPLNSDTVGEFMVQYSATVEVADDEAGGGE